MLATVHAFSPMHWKQVTVQAHDSIIPYLNGRMRLQDFAHSWNNYMEKSGYAWKQHGISESDG